MESSYFQQAVTFIFVFTLQLAWPPHSLACSTAPAPQHLLQLVSDSGYMIFLISLMVHLFQLQSHYGTVYLTYPN